MRFRYTGRERPVPEQTHPFIPREAETRYLSELGEVSTQLVLVEAMRNPAQINYTRLRYLCSGYNEFMFAARGA